MDQVDAPSVIATKGPIKTRAARSILAAHADGAVQEKYPYAEQLKALYEGISSTTGDAVIVDSSKSPSDAIIAASLPGHDVYLLHMVRDPRAVAFSWQRHKRAPDKADDAGYMSRIGILKSAVTWTFYNYVILRHVRRALRPKRYKRLRYETFMDEPNQTVRDLVRFVGMSPEDVPEAVDGMVNLAASHTASGNPSRFVTGPVPLRRDDDWSRQMGWRQKAVATLASLPLLHALGYRIWR